MIQSRSVEYFWKRRKEKQAPGVQRIPSKGPAPNSNSLVSDSCPPRTRRIKKCRMRRRNTRGCAWLGAGRAPRWTPSPDWGEDCGGEFLCDSSDIHLLRQLHESRFQAVPFEARLHLGDRPRRHHLSALQNQKV